MLASGLGMAASFTPVGMFANLLGGGGGDGGGGGGFFGAIADGLGSIFGGGSSEPDNSRGWDMQATVAHASQAYAGQMGGYPSQYGYSTGATGPPPPPPAQPVAMDKACDIATQLAPMLTHLYENLGGKDKTIDWSKFDDPKDIGWLRGSFNGHKNSTDLTNSEPSNKVRKSCEQALEVRCHDTLTNSRTSLSSNCRSLTSSKITGKECEMARTMTSLLKPSTRGK